MSTQFRCGGLLITCHLQDWQNRRNVIAIAHFQGIIMVTYSSSFKCKILVLMHIKTLVLKSLLIFESIPKYNVKKMHSDIFIGVEQRHRLWYKREERTFSRAVRNWGKMLRRTKSWRFRNRPLITHKNPYFIQIFIIHGVRNTKTIIVTISSCHEFLQAQLNISLSLVQAKLLSCGWFEKLIWCLDRSFDAKLFHYFYPSNQSSSNRFSGRWVRCDLLLHSACLSGELLMNSGREREHTSQISALASDRTFKGLTIWHSLCSCQIEEMHSGHSNGRMTRMTILYW